MSSTNHVNSAAPSASSSGMRGEIAAKWGKFDTAEIAALKDKDELVSHVAKKYNIEQSQAQRDVDTFAKGRSL